MITSLKAGAKLLKSLKWKYFVKKIENSILSFAPTFKSGIKKRVRKQGSSTPAGKSWKAA
jgi:hypothetical protein